MPQWEPLRSELALSGESVVRFRTGRPGTPRRDPFDVAIVDPLVEPVPAGWDALVARERLSPLWTSALIRTADWHCAVATSFAVVSEAASGDVVALVHARHLGPGVPGRYARPGRVPPVSLTECRLAPGLDAGLAFASGTTVEQRRAAVAAYERALRRRTGPGGVGLAYRELGEADRHVVPGAGRVQLRLSPCLVLTNRWSDVDSYLRDRPARWRAQLRKIRSGLDADPGVRVEVADRIDGDDAAWLAELVRRRHHPPLLARPPLPSVYFG